MSVYSRLRNLFRGGKLDRELRDELEFHREMRVQKGLARGLSAEDADREARRRLGNIEVAREEMRDARVIRWLEETRQDLRHGIVLLRRDAGISSLIVLVLALGIGGNTAIFTLLKAALLDPLPYREAGGLRTVVTEGGWSPSVSEFVEIRARARALEQAAYIEHRDMQLMGADGPVRVFGARVTASFFSLLGVGAALGRTFGEEENRPGQPAVVVLTDAFWRSKLSADPNAVGRTLRIDGQPAVVVGVLPAGFQFDYPTLRISEPVEVYAPFTIEPPVNFRAGGSGASSAFRMLARLRPGATQEQAQSELESVAQSLPGEHPTAYRTREGGQRSATFDAVALREAIVGAQRSLLWLLLGGVGVLLLIACANTMQLLLARSLRRRREVAIRAALGAGRLRLIRQFVLEGLVLAVCGGTVGLLLSGWMTRILVALLPARSPILESAHADASAVGFTIALSAVSAMVFASIPAVKGSRWTPGGGLRSPAGAGEGNGWRHAMIAIEAALSMFLLCGAGLVAQNLWTLIATPTGFDASHVLAMRLKAPPRTMVPPPGPRQGNTPGPKESVAFEEYLQRIAVIPGVDSAAMVTGPPLRPSVSGPTEMVGVTESGGRLKSVIAYNHLVSPDYFRTLRIPLVAGRMFREGDEVEPWRVAIVNEEFARQFGLGRDAVGRKIFEPGEGITIIGMVGNVRTRGLEAAPFPEVYLSSLRFSWTSQYLVVRSAMAPGALVKQVKAALESANSEQAVFGVKTMDEMLADSVTEPRFYVFLIGAFALLAVLMATAGMYGVISCLVTQRTIEIAIRLALGASGGSILRTILGATTVWVTMGLACGLGLGLAARSTVRAFSRTAVEGSPWMYAAVVVFFLMVTLIAAYAPLRRIGRLDPSAALRCE